MLATINITCHLLSDVRVGQRLIIIYLFCFLPILSEWYSTHGTTNLPSYPSGCVRGDADLFVYLSLGGCLETLKISSCFSYLKLIYTCAVKACRSLYRVLILIWCCISLNRAGHMIMELNESEQRTGTETFTIFRFCFTEAPVNSRSVYIWQWATDDQWLKLGRHSVGRSKPVGVLAKLQPFFPLLFLHHVHEFDGCICQWPGQRLRRWARFKTKRLQFARPLA